MALNEIEQIKKVVEKSNHILVVFRKDFSIDALSSALALSLVFKKMGKLSDVICQDFQCPKNLAFLPGNDQVKPQLQNLQKFVIAIDIKNDKVENFSYDITGDQLKIYLTPKSGSFSPDDVSTTNSDFKYDLIITLDTPDLESLGPMTTTFADFFYNTTIINIDHHPSNEHFGQINLTNFNAVSTTEVLYKLIEAIDSSLLDKDVATCLLTGMITETKSFKSAMVTPHTLEVAGKLLSLDANRDTIITSLYRSRSLATMNLWGRVLARLRNGPDRRLVWSLLSENDFVEARAEEADLPDVIDELIAFVPGVEVVALIYHYKGTIRVIVQVLKSHNAIYLTKAFTPTGSKRVATFELPDTTLAEAEKKVTEQIKKQLGEQSS